MMVSLGRGQTYVILHLVVASQLSSVLAVLQRIPVQKDRNKIHKNNVF